ncbi:interleukin-9 [Macrotis lagotis]|uniref:interleukin-9 n=1 Tax=Macrotis lagotis TaxID=92651 RepID=UPI003D69F70D
MFFHGLFLSILLLSLSRTPAQVQNQLRSQRISISLGKLCSDPKVTEITQNLIDHLEKEPAATCDCNVNVTGCLCLPVPSKNCSTSCFHSGLTKMNHTMKPEYRQNIARVQNYVWKLKHRKCKPFSCSQPCNETLTANTMEFLKALQENFQKLPISNN